MSAQPATLQPPLTPATKSTDTTPPTSAVTSATTVQYGVATTITGTATDAGGVVGAVEVSVDGGQTWHPATGRENWSYPWVPSSVSGSATVRVRASDDSANLQTSPTSVTITVEGGPSCPCSIWPNSTVPVTSEHNDTSAVELGLKFRSDAAGSVSGVRFYKGSNNTGTHIGNLWTTDGTRLASVTFTNETASGWQEASFSSPVPIAANTTYVISYYAPNGWYAGDMNFFNASGVDRLPLHALASGVDGPNGVFIYASGGGFPTQTFNAANYWVDVVFSASNAPAPIGPVMPAAPHSVWLAWAASTSMEISGYNVYRATAPGGPYVMLNTSLVTETAYVDSEVASGETYFYIATAVDSNTNESPYSNEAIAVVPTP
jgi:hypothetical protein